LAKSDSSFFEEIIGFRGFCGWAHSMLKRLQHLTGAKTSASYPQMAGIACISAFFFFSARSALNLNQGGALRALNLDDLAVSSVEERRDPPVQRLVTFARLATVRA
jgi:hypothetical protein